MPPPTQLSLSPPEKIVSPPQGEEEEEVVDLPAAADRASDMDTQYVCPNARTCDPPPTSSKLLLWRCHTELPCKWQLISMPVPVPEVAFVLFAIRFLSVSTAAWDGAVR